MDEHVNKIYLSDGAYAIFTGYSIQLAVNHHENVVVELELDAIERLYAFTKRQIELNKK